MFTEAQLLNKWKSRFKNQQAALFKGRLTPDARKSLTHPFKKNRNKCNQICRNKKTQCIKKKKESAVYFLL